MIPLFLLWAMLFTYKSKYHLLTSSYLWWQDDEAFQSFIQNLYLQQRTNIHGHEFLFMFSKNKLYKHTHTQTLVHMVYSTCLMHPAICLLSKEMYYVVAALMVFFNVVYNSETLNEALDLQMTLFAYFLIFFKTCHFWTRILNCTGAQHGTWHLAWVWQLLP